MSGIVAAADVLPNHGHPEDCGANSEPDIVGYLKNRISEIIQQFSAVSDVDKSENGAANLIGVGAGLAVTENERLKGYLKDTAQLMIKEVDEVTEQVLHLCRMRTNLKRKRSRAAVSSKNADRGKASKKQRMVFLARSEAAHRRRMSDVFRECSSILKQIMQHKWCGPFIQPVDVAGSGFCNYYDINERPMDLRNVQDRLEAEDGLGYNSAHEICEDVRLVFRNAMACNLPGTDIYKYAKALLEKFEEKWRNVLEPKLIELEVLREEEQGCSGIGCLDSEIAAKKYSDEVFQKLSNIEKDIEEFLRATTSKCRAMSMMEKEELVRRIRDLPPNGLNRVVEIIEQAETSLDISAEEIHVDLDKADPATLWRLYYYCRVTIPDFSVGNG
ncbi:transcription factor GTE6 isoform X2 [Cryptomeria japonica]|uniref:transcription factor GTE6 isoform X2 n=1 Tax=Cryptomeria japonica TaxID=3369 RepID=UPI0025AC4203|nr:transcription factor GTE6 isoform X2 [Cryptomeria japonica]